jgi:putative transposase
MPRRNVPSSAIHPTHINARCANREWFKIPLPEVWCIMENYLSFIHHAYDIKIHSFVLMPNHFHLIASTPKTNISEAMNYFMRETSRQIGYASNRINQVYGGRFHRTVIKDAKYFLCAYKYVYRNPVKGELAAKVEDYPFSTLSGKLGLSKIFIPVEEDTLLFSSPFCDRTLGWLNAKPSKENDESIRLALRRRIFELPKVKGALKPNPLETDEY